MTNQLQLELVKLHIWQEVFYHYVKYLENTFVEETYKNQPYIPIKLLIHLAIVL